MDYSVYLIGLCYVVHLSSYSKHISFFIQLQFVFLYCFPLISLDSLFVIAIQVLSDLALPLFVLSPPLKNSSLF